MTGKERRIVAGKENCDRKVNFVAGKENFVTGKENYVTRKVKFVRKG